MAKKVDANQASIVEALRAIGASVICLHTVGQGCPDLLVGYRNRNFIMEVKNGNARLTKKEEELRRTWQGLYFVVRSAQEAVDTLEYHAQEV